MNRLKPPFHNFDLPWLKWGNQKLLRCMNVDSNADVSVLHRNHSPDRGGSGASVIKTRRRNTEFRSSCYDDRKIDSFSRFSSSEKVNVHRNQPSDSYGGGGCTIGRKRLRSSYDDDYKTQSYYNLSSSEKLTARNGNLITGDGEIEATREKLMFDFQTEVVKMKDAILRERLVSTPPSTAAPSYNTPSERPWNLRTRRSPAKGVNKSGDVFEPLSSPAIKLRPANGGSDETASGERPKFSVSLSRREVEEDFLAIAGRRLPRKPKKRPRAVQKQLDTLFPGLWLSEVTADLYKVPDETETGKRSH